MNNRRVREFLSVIVWQPLLVYVYLCLPRALLVWRVPNSELQLTHGFFDQTLAYIGTLFGVFNLIRLVSTPGVRRTATRLLILWIHLDFLIRCGEAALMYQFDIGYSSLFFYHLQWESIRLALSQYWYVLVPAVAVVAGADWVLRRVLDVTLPWDGMSTTARVATVVMLLFGVRCAFVMHRERRRATEDYAAASLLMNWQAYADQRNDLARVTLTAAEQSYLRTMGLGLQRLRLPPVHTNRPAKPLNLITIYLEGFQANFTGTAGGPYKDLTPNLDRFASRALFMGSFYNAVTPTINALISSQCGILSQVENDSLDNDRGYTRNLRCLPDILHDHGYHQEFMGGADSGFAGKRLFLNAHQYDEVWGWEQWGTKPSYTADGRRNAWGLNDTDLVKEAVARLPELAAHSPFHLSLLTVNTHQPGYKAGDCPEYTPNRLMLNAIYCTDYAIGTLFDALESGGYLENTAVIVMGDHMMFPTPENASALGPAAGDWFGKVFMAVYWPSGPHPGRMDKPAYTPDFAPIALDVLGFSPLPRFAFGRSPISAPDPRRTLIASHYQILNGAMVPQHPTLDNECSPEVLVHTTLSGTPVMSPCGREKVIESVDKLLESTLPEGRKTSN